MKTRVCQEYEGKPTVTDSFCARRYRKSLAEPKDPALDGCRTCSIGHDAANRFAIAKITRGVSVSRRRGNIASGRAAKIKALMSKLGLNRRCN